MSFRALGLVAVALAAFAAAVAPVSAEAAGPACAAENYGQHGSFVRCPSLGFVAVLPGRGWTVREAVPGSPRVIFAARHGRSFNVAVSTADPAGATATATDPPTILRELYARAAAASRARGIELTPPDLGESRPFRPTLSYEARAISVNGEPHRSVHVWTYAGRPAGGRLVYHASWTGPEADYDRDLPETLLAMTAGFVLVDATGRPLAE